VTIVISDGWGINHIQAASYYTYGKDAHRVYSHFPVSYYMSTYEYDGGYDPSMAWADFGYVMGGATDSAAAATTTSIGVKTNGGAVGVDPNQAPLFHALDLAEDLGKSTGVVSSVEFSHTTPVGFVPTTSFDNSGVCKGEYDGGVSPRTPAAPARISGTSVARTPGPT
jgi:alkaline phosphatase